MSNVIYMYDYYCRKQKEKRADYERRTGVKLGLLLERVGIMREEKKREILKESQRLVSAYQINNNNNGGGNAE